MKENQNENKIDLNNLEEAAQLEFGKNWKNLSNDGLCRIFRRCPWGLSFVLDDAIKFVIEHCPKGKKISFIVLNEFNRFKNIEVCELKTLFDFIDQSVEQNSYNSNFTKYELDFYAYLYRYVKSNLKTLDDENKKYIQYFIGRQRNLLIDICTYHNQFYLSNGGLDLPTNYMEEYVHLAVGSLKFKDYMKQYVHLSDLQNDILQHIKMIVDCCNNNKYDDSAIEKYLCSFYNRHHFDEKRIKEIFDADFMDKLKDTILGENKKISCWYQMVFLRDVYSFCHDRNTSNYLFETVYKFVFDNQNSDEIKETIVETYRKAQDRKRCMYENFIKKFMSGIDNFDNRCYEQSVKADSTEFANFCNMFSLKSKMVVRFQKPKYFSCFNGKLIDNYNWISCVTLKKNLLSEENSRPHIVYKVFVKIAFLIFGVVPLVILKSVFDILLLVIKSIINIVCCVVIAFRRKKYGKPIKEIFLAILSIVVSPVLCSYNNFRDSKYLFCITGSGKKILTFDNWYFFNSEEKIRDIYNAKNFNISNISLWFFIKYIFGFERIIRLDKFDNKYRDVDLKLTVESVSSKNEEENKIIKRQQIPISEYTNEYSPLRYF